MSLKAKIEAIIYATEEPVSVDQIVAALKNQVTLEDIMAPDSSTPSSVAPLDDRGDAFPRDKSDNDKGDSEIADRTLTPAQSVEGAEVRGEGRIEARISDSRRSASENKPEFKKALKSAAQRIVAELIAEYAAGQHGIEIREIAGGYRMGTKPEQHDAVRAFAKSLKPPVRLSLPALETLAVIAYKQPVTAPEIGEIRGVDVSGVLATLLERKLVTTAGRKAVVGRPILYKTTREFMLRFGLNNLAELPTMEEFEKMAGSAQEELFPAQLGDEALADATGVPDDIADHLFEDQAFADQPVVATEKEQELIDAQWMREHKDS